MRTAIEYAGNAATQKASRHSALRGLFSALCLGKERLFAMVSELTSYCDEFGHANDPQKKFMGMAGLLGWSSAWVNFDEDWKAICAEEGIPSPFHMVDFVHHAEKFDAAPWTSPERRLKVLGRLLGAIERAGVAPIGASVVLADFNGLTEDQKKRLRSPYYTAFQEITSLLAFAAADTALRHAVEFSQTKVSMVYAKLRGYTGPAEELWNAVKHSSHPSGHWMSSYTVGDPTDFSPLQAADIWAYSLGHMGEH